MNSTSSTLFKWWSMTVKHAENLPVGSTYAEKLWDVADGIWSRYEDALASEQAADLRETHADFLMGRI